MRFTRELSVLCLGAVAACSQQPTFSALPAQALRSVTTSSSWSRPTIGRSPHTTFRYFSFNRTDGAEPHAGLTALNGTLYGTTTFGGARGDGTVFAIDAFGQESV